MQKTILLLALAFLGLNITNAQVGIGTTSPDASAALDVDVTSLTEKKGFLPPRMTETERDGIADPATGLAIYNTDTNCVQFYTGATWYNTCSINLVTPSVYSPSTGQIWMDRNLGANQVATSPTDSDSYGNLYQWGRGTDGHQLRSLDCSNAADCFDAGGDNTNLPATAADVTNATWNGKFIINMENGVLDPRDWIQGPSDNSLWQGVDGINNPCPAGYRVPTVAEWEAELLTWADNNASEAFASPLKLPTGGFRNRADGSLVYDDTGRYWSSTAPSGSNAFSAGYLFFSSTTALTNNFPRAQGFSVRCLQD